MFTAIITRNFRDVNTSSPKVLLLQVQSDSKIFRDHCWVTISDALEEFVPRKNHIKNKICFDAKVKEYQTYGPVKQTLISLKNIIRLNKYEITKNNSITKICPNFFIYFQNIFKINLKFVKKSKRKCMKRKVLTLAIGVSCSIMMTGCATLFGGGAKQNITIKSSEPKNLSLHYIDDKNVTSPAVQTFQTPATISVGRENKDILLKDTSGKCEDTRVKKETNDWIWGDVIALSLLSTTVDAVTGAMWEYDDNVTIECQK